MNLRPVLFINGIFLSILALSMVFPMLADLYIGSSDWKVFFTGIVITSFFGGALILSNAGVTSSFSIRQAFVLIALSWFSITAFGALPFHLSAMNMSITDSFFEAMSGITTTGATVITDLDHAPPGILLWRAILQWLGGVGVILMAMSVLPFLNIGGMQIFRVELSENEKALPRAAKLASSIGSLYVILTIICAVFYMFTGMRKFDAIAHAMTTISTGGFSTYDASFGHFAGSWADLVAITFMIVGGLPFVLYLKTLSGDKWALFRDSQVRTFIGIVFATVLIMSASLVLQYNEHTMLSALRESTFNIVSVITGTGYANANYSIWGGLSVAIFFFLMVIGACAGSTTCGIKVFRFQILYAVVKTQVKNLIHPHGVFVPHYNNKRLSPEVTLSVMSFFFLYALCFGCIAIGLSFTGLDFMTAMSGAVTAISNVGPGLGEIIGPAGNFSPLPDTSKWILCIGMFLGRLEIFPVIVLLSPHFWRR